MDNEIRISSSEPDTTPVVSPPEDLKKKGKLKYILIIILAAVLLGIGAGAAYFYLNKNNNKNTDMGVGLPGVDGSELIIAEWGLKFDVPEGLSDVRYKIDGDTIYFIGKPAGVELEYISNIENLIPGNALGMLYRSTEPNQPRTPEETVEGMRIDEYYYYTSSSFSRLSNGTIIPNIYIDENGAKYSAQVLSLINDKMLSTIKVSTE